MYRINGNPVKNEVHLVFVWTRACAISSLPCAYSILVVVGICDYVLWNDETGAF